MNKKVLKKIMNEYNISELELDDVLAFVADLLYLIARDLEENQSYAVREINSLLDASTVVDSLMDYYIP